MPKILSNIKFNNYMFWEIILLILLIWLACIFPFMWLIYAIIIVLFIIAIKNN